MLVDRRDLTLAGELLNPKVFGGRRATAPQAAAIDLLKPDAAGDLDLAIAAPAVRQRLPDGDLVIDRGLRRLAELGREQAADQLAADGQAGRKGHVADDASICRRADP